MSDALAQESFDEGWERGYAEGAAVAFGIMGMAQAIRDRADAVIEPEQGQNAPNMSWTGYGNVERPDKGCHGLCACSRCHLNKKVHRVDVWPFMVSDPKARAEGEPTATIEYGGVRIFVTHTFIARVASLTRLDTQSCYEESYWVLGNGLEEMNRRMWRALGYQP